MVKLVNRAKMSTSTTGTGSISLVAAEDGYQTFADAGVTAGDVVSYVIEDGNSWEIGNGAYTGVPSVSAGLSSSLFSVSGQNASWVQRTVDLSAYAGATVRLVFKHQIAASGTSYYADLQLDQIAVDGTLYDFESSLHSFETTTSGSYTNYTDAVFSTLGTGTTGERWNRDAGGTPSSTTGLTTGADSTTYYVYTESSSPTSLSDIFWLRSPEITLSGDVGNLTFYEARYGSAIGTLNVYVDVTEVSYPTLQRSVTESSNSGSAISLSGDAKVFVTATVNELYPYTSKTVSLNHTLDTNVEYETGSGTTINNGVTLTIPSSSQLTVNTYSEKRPL